MALKNVLPVFQIFNGAVMTGTTVLTSAPSNISLKDDIMYQLQWSGSPVGTFAVEISLDYNPGLPQSAGAMNPGQWNTVPAVDSLGNPPVAAGSAGLLNIGIMQAEAPWIRIQYTNASGVGALTGYVVGKSVGL